jgi:hypothetical protein
MGAKSFNLWPRCEEIIDSLPDGRKHWRNKHLPLIPGEEENQIGSKMIGRPAMSKSLFVNEAIIHYYDKNWFQIRRARDALQEHVRVQNAEIEDLKKQLDEAQSRGGKGILSRLFRGQQ